MNFKSEFIGASEAPLSDSSAWDATSIDRANNLAVPSSPAVASLVNAVALLDDPVATSRNQYVRAVMASKEERQLSIIVIGVTEGTTTLITLASAHGRTGWGYVTIAGTGGFAALNATHICDYDTSTTSLTLNFDTSGETVTIPSPSTATCVPADAQVDVFARIATATTSVSFSPASGYIMRLSYENNKVRKLRFIRYDMGAAGTELSLKVSADIGSAAATQLTRNNSDATTDLGIGQDLRLYVEDLRGGGVRLRGYINNLDDQNPDFEFTDHGDDTGSGAVSQLGVSRDDAGLVGFRFWNEHQAARYFEGSDYATEELEGLVKHGIDLATLRARLKLRLERSTTGVLTNTFYDQIINEAQHELIERLGGLAMFMRKTESVDLVSEETGATGAIRFTLGRHVKILQNIVSTTTYAELDWSFHSLQDDGRLKIELATQAGGPPYEMTYFARTEELIDGTDLASIPMEFAGCLIQLAIMKGAQYHSDAKLELSAIKEYERLYKIFSKAMSNIVRQSRGNERFRGRQRREARTIVPPWQLWGVY